MHEMKGIKYELVGISTSKIYTTESSGCTSMLRLTYNDMTRIQKLRNMMNARNTHQFTDTRKTVGRCSVVKVWQTWLLLRVVPIDWIQCVCVVEYWGQSLWMAQF